MDVFRPVNRVEMAGERIVLPCSSRANNDSRWEFYSQDDGKPVTLYRGGVHGNARRRVYVDYSSCRRKTCNISLTSLQFDDAGYYVCFEASRPERIGAALVVLGTQHYMLSFLTYSNS